MKRFLTVLGAAVMVVSFAVSAPAADCCKKQADSGKCPDAAKSAAKKVSSDPTVQDVVLDPVCGMDVKVSDSKFKSEYKGKTYNFCSADCKKSFDKDPSRYIGGSKKKK
jgi:YHS domain-containing protein